MQNNVIEANGLYKSFPGGVHALRGLDLAVPAGTVYGLVGRNGAGKTTALRLVMGLLRPTSGGARVLGADMRTASRAHRAQVTYVSQGQTLPGALTIGELAFSISHFYPSWDDALASELARRFELPTDRPVGTLSGGQQREAAMALAFSARPRALVLDEPAAGLDPVARRRFLEALIDLLAQNESAAVLLSTHILADLERLATRIGFLDGGRLVRESELDDLKSRFRRLQVVFENGAPPAGWRLPGVIRQRAEGAVVTGLVEIENPAAIENLRRTPGLRVTEVPINLEDLTIELLGSQPDGGAGNAPLSLEVSRS